MQNPISPLSCVLAAIVGFTVVALAEFGIVASSTAVFDAGTGPGLTVLAHMIGLIGVAGLVIGVLYAIVVPPLIAAVAPWRWARAHLWPARETPAPALHGAAAGIVATLVAAGLLAVTAGIAGRVAHGFNNPNLVLPFVALGGLAGAGIGVLAWFPARQASRLVFGRIAPSGRLAGLPAPLLPTLVVGLACAFVVYRLSAIDLGAYKLGGLQALVVGLALSLLLLAVWRERTPVRPGAVSLLWLLVVAGCGGWAILGLGDAAVSARIIPGEGHLSRLVVQRLRAVFDGDGDGYSALLAGGDCDDENPKVGPHAREIPGNGVDDNCVGGDAPVEDIADVAPPSAPPTAPAVAGVTEPPPPPKPRHNVVFILIDTLRPDHLGLYGYERATSPNIDAWAKDAVVFDDVWAQAPNTPRSMPSILTGRYPSRIQWVERYANYGSLKPENESIFELFQAGGWRTEVVSAHWYFERAGGIKDGVDLWDNRGFTTIKESNTQTIAHELTPRAVARIEALAAGDQPFFLLVHYFEPHGRYMNQPSATVFGKELVDKYDSEISYVDKHLAPLLAALDKPGVKEKTAVVITADHGEAFKEHGLYFHGRTVYHEELRVPLVMRVPGVAPRRVPDLTGLIDLLPSLAELVGLKPARAQGRSFLPAFDGTALPDRTLFGEQLPYPNYQTHMVGVVRSDGMRVVRNVTDNVTEVFDLKKDPKEKTNLLGADPSAAEDLRQALDRFLDADPG